LHIHRLQSLTKDAALADLIGRVEKQKFYRKDKSSELDKPGMDTAQRIDYHRRFRGKEDGVPTKTVAVVAVCEGTGFLAEISAFETDFDENSKTIDALVDSFKRYLPTSGPAAEIGTVAPDKRESKVK
jgi:hypothetical protein